MNSQTSSSLNKCNNNTIVKLNVGGKLFKTFYSTLSTSTFFQNLLNKDVMESKTIINDGEIFIDRSAILFRDILLFLRTSIIFAFDIDKLNALQLEAEYYQIESMIQAVQASINENSEHKDDHTLLYSSRQYCVSQSPESLLSAFEQQQAQLILCSFGEHYFEVKLPISCLVFGLSKFYLSNALFSGLATTSNKTVEPLTTNIIGVTEVKDAKDVWRFI
ncbi:hypothetical protein INT46_010926 [Mucor plumbeus]|uniref:BTB domain-containing protein n=1 Tax=Mucor plumbeus TaxID=97098 RepID=A0A8H7RGJ5_9FUNG|nr:hypothetical protein INT46_010926 [Mucor plumbeus]